MVEEEQGLLTVCCGSVHLGTGMVDSKVFAVVYVISK